MDGQFTTKKTVPETDGSTGYAESLDDFFQSLKPNVWKENPEAENDYDNLEPYRAGAPAAEPVPVNKVESWGYSRPSTLFKVASPVEDGDMRVYSLDSKKTVYKQPPPNSYTHLDDGSLKVRALEPSYARYGQTFYGETEAKPIFRRSLGTISDGTKVSYSNADGVIVPEKISRLRAMYGGGYTPETYKTETPIHYEALSKLKDKRVAGELQGTTEVTPGVTSRSERSPYMGISGTTGSDIQRFMSVRPMETTDSPRRSEMFVQKTAAPIGAEGFLKEPALPRTEFHKTAGQVLAGGDFSASTIDSRRARGSVNMNAELGTQTFESPKINRLDGGPKGERGMSEVSTRLYAETSEKKPVDFSGMTVSKSFEGSTSKMLVADGFVKNGSVALPTYSEGTGRLEIKDGRQVLKGQPFTSETGKIDIKSAEMPRGQSISTGQGRIEFKDDIGPKFSSGFGKIQAPVQSERIPNGQAFTSGFGKLDIKDGRTANVIPNPGAIGMPSGIRRTLEIRQPGMPANIESYSLPGSKPKAIRETGELIKEKSGSVEGYNPRDQRPTPDYKPGREAISRANPGEIGRVKSEGFIPGNAYRGDGKLPPDAVKKPEGVTTRVNGSNVGDRTSVTDQIVGKKNVVRENPPNAIDIAGGSRMTNPSVVGNDKGNKGTGTVAAETAVKVNGQPTKPGEQPGQKDVVKAQTPESGRAIPGPKVNDSQPRSLEPRGNESLPKGGPKNPESAPRVIEAKVPESGPKVVDRGPKAVESGQKVSEGVTRVEPRTVEHGPKVVSGRSVDPAHQSGQPDGEIGKRGTRLTDASAAQNPLITGDRKTREGSGSQNPVAVRVPAEHTGAGEGRQWLNHKNQISANVTLDANSTAARAFKNWTDSKGVCGTARYMGGEVLLASFIIAAGIARRMPEQAPGPQARTAKENEPVRAQGEQVRGQKHHIQPDKAIVQAEGSERVAGKAKAPAQAIVRPEGDSRVQATGTDRSERTPIRIEDGAGPRIICDTTSKRFLSGIEIAALIAAGGIAKVRSDGKQSEVKDSRPQDGSPSAKPGSAEIAGARNAAKTGDRVANNIQPAQDSRTPSITQAGRVPDTRDTNQSPAAKTERIHSDRFIPGADIAIAALMVASGVAKLRNDQKIDSTTSKTEPSGRIMLDRGLKGIFFTLNTDRRPPVATTNDALPQKVAQAPSGEKKSILPTDNKAVAPGVSQAKVEQGIADLLQRMAEQEFVFDGEDEAKAKDKARISEIVSTAFGGIFGRVKAEIEGEATQDEELEKDTESTGEEANAATTAMYRPIRLIAPGETFVGIAERLYGDPLLGWLIADLNPGKFNETRMDGKRIIEIQSRQKIELPVWQDIIEFNSNRPKEADPDNLITIVTETTLDQELLASNFQTFLSPERKKVARPVFSPVPQMRPATARALRPVGQLGVTGMTRPQFASIAAAVSLPLILPPCEVSQPHDLTRGPVQETIIDALPSAEPNS